MAENKGLKEEREIIREEYEENKVLAKRLKEVIKLRGYKVYDVAREVGLTPKAIYAFIRGDTFPSVESLGKITAYLSVSADYLLGHVDKPDEIMPKSKEDPIYEDIHMFRRAYEKMDKKEQEIVRNFFKSLIKNKEI